MFNTAVGYLAMNSLVNGGGNTAMGHDALQTDVSGNDNTALGFNALRLNTGSYNTAVGSDSLAINSSGTQNTAVGRNALEVNQTGANNTAVGFQALLNNTGSNNIGIGQNAGASLTSGSNNIMIGYGGAGGISGTIIIGDPAVITRAFLAGVRGVQTGVNNAATVMIDSANQLGTTNSSRRFKEDIESMGDASSKMLQLRPVTFRYKRAYQDGTKPVDYGLIAEEVAQVYPDLVVKSPDGKYETVQYHKSRRCC
jgi:hypothetical protein